MSDRTYYGVYRGTVFSNKDPLQKRRLRVVVPAITGEGPTSWAWPLETASIKSEPPAVNQGVWVMFENGDPAYPIWVGTFGKEVSGDYPLLFERLDPSEIVPDITDLLSIKKFSDNTNEVDVTQTLLNIVRNRCFGNFYSLQVVNAVPNAIQYFPFGEEQFSCSNVTVTNNNELRLAGVGVFNVQFSAQFTSTNSSASDVDIWLEKNGTAVPNTNTRITLTGNGVEVVPAWNFFIEGGGPTDYWKIAWSTDTDKIILDSIGPQSNPTRPAIPSVILTVSKVK